MTTFVLIHGGGHRGWHWHLTRPLLEKMGHRTIAPNVPMDDPKSGAELWAEVVAKAMNDAGGTDDTIVVGHSLAGLMLPVLASMTPVRRLVFLGANVPVPSISYNQYLEDHQDAIVVPWERLDFDDQGRILVSWELAREVYYPDVEESLARQAYARLLPVTASGFSEACPITSWPDVPSSYILGKDDLVNGPSWARRVSAERFGEPAIELPGGHSPFLARPDVLATTLDGIATRRD